MRILVVDDEEINCDLLRRRLERKGYSVDTVGDGSGALEKIQNEHFDMVLLDIMLPEIDGFTICRTLRKKGMATPILMLTARNAVNDRIQGLDAGADDYLSKPFAIGELLARVRALLRRGREDKRDHLKIADLELDLLKKQARRAGKGISLTSKEYMLLEYMAINAHQVLSRTMIAEHVWNENFNNFTNVIDVHIRYLRSKIDDGNECPLIHTVRGMGYVLTDEPRD